MLTATASSGLTPVISSNTPSVCTVSGFVLTLISSGSCSLTASQGGDSTYGAASAVSGSIYIPLLPQMTVSPTWAVQGSPFVNGYFNLTNRVAGAATPYGTWIGTLTLSYSVTFTICGIVVPTTYMADGSPRTPNYTEFQQGCPVTANVTASDAIGSSSVSILGGPTIPYAFTLLTSPTTLNYPASGVAVGTVVSSPGATFSSYVSIPIVSTVSRCSTTCVVVSSSINGYTATNADVGSHLVFSTNVTYGNWSLTVSLGSTPVVTP